MSILLLETNVLYSIISQLALDDIQRLLQTCTFFRDLFNNEDIFRYLFAYYLYPSPYYIDTGIGDVHLFDWSWKEHYREQYYLQYLKSISQVMELPLYHRYLNCEDSDGWTIINERETGKIGEIEDPIAVCFYRLGMKRDGNDIPNILKSEDGYEDTFIDGEDGIVSLIKDLDIHEQKKDFKSETITDNSNISNDNDKPKICEEEGEAIDLSQQIENSSSRDFERDENWVKLASSQFTYAISRKLGYRSIIQDDFSPLSNFWKECSEEFIKDFALKLLTKKIPHSTLVSGNIKPLDEEYAKKFCVYLYKLFKMDKGSYKSYYSVTAETTLFCNRHYEGICIVGEHRFVYMNWVWEMDENVSFSVACTDIHAFLGC